MGLTRSGWKKWQSEAAFAACGEHVRLNFPDGVDPRLESEEMEIQKHGRAAA